MPFKGNGQPTRIAIDLADQLKAIGLPLPEKEYRFHPTRKWRVDYFLKDYRLCVEVEGGFFARKGSKKCPTCNMLPPGRHLTAQGATNDLSKYNELTILGYRLIRVTPQMIKTGEALTIIERAVKALQTNPAPIIIQDDLFG